MTAAILLLYWDGSADTETRTASGQATQTIDPETEEIGPGEATEDAPTASKTPEGSSGSTFKAAPLPEARVETVLEKTASLPSPQPEYATGADLEIEEHLLSARDALEDYRLSTPKGDNAYYHSRMGPSGLSARSSLGLTDPHDTTGWYPWTQQDDKTG